MMFILMILKLLILFVKLLSKNIDKYVKNYINMSKCIFYHQLWKLALFNDQKPIIKFYMIEICFFSWDKTNNQGLCDLKEIQNLKQQKLKNFKIKDTGVIYRNIVNHQLTFKPIKNVLKQQIQQQNEAIIFVTEMDKQYKLTNLKYQNKPNQWLSILSPTQQQKSTNQLQSLKVFQGSILKLGKAIIQIHKIEGSSLAKNYNLYKKPSSELMESIKKVSKEDYKFQQEGQEGWGQGEGDEGSFKGSEEEKTSGRMDKQLVYSFEPLNPICKICYSRTLENDNILVSLCKCSGSTKFIHQICLKKWVQHKSQLVSFQKKNKKSIFMASMKGFQCQICKQYYPIDKVFQLLFRKKQQSIKQFIILSVLANQQKSIYVINLQNTPSISIGRDLENDVIVNDLTVSRKHCKIQLTKDQKFLELTDLGSKFGSSIKKSSIILNDRIFGDRQLGVKLQRGRTFLQIKKIKDVENNGFFRNLLFCNRQSQ